MRRPAWIFILLFVVTAFFLAKSLTGYAVSQTCCLGFECESENLCTVPSQQSEFHDINVLFGVMFSVVITSLFVAYGNGTGEI